MLYISPKYIIFSSNNLTKEKPKQKKSFALMPRLMHSFNIKNEEVLCIFNNVPPQQTKKKDFFLLLPQIHFVNLEEKFLLFRTRFAYQTLSTSKVSTNTCGVMWWGVYISPLTYLSHTSFVNMLHSQAYIFKTFHHALLMFYFCSKICDSFLFRRQQTIKRRKINWKLNWHAVCSATGDQIWCWPKFFCF